VEEKALIEGLGKLYEEYIGRTKPFIPFVFRSWGERIEREAGPGREHAGWLG
jgi:hypothetical protein